MLITDQRMPGMSGTELLRKSHTIDPDIVCMLITSENDAGTFIDALMHSGAIRVINKPWKPDQLLEVIEAALEKQETLSEAKKAMNQLKRASESLDRVVKG
jgi:DNA-binding NtrC family response regulator